MSQNKNSTPRPSIAVVGASALFPGSIDGTGFWRDLLEGNDLITDVPPSHWLVEDYYDADPSAPDKTYAKRGAFLKDVDFDALGWGVPPNILPATDTAQLLALIVAQRVLHDATQGRFRDMDRSRTSVILGVTSAQELLASMVSRLQRPVWVKALRESGLPESQVQEVCQRISDEYVPWQESTFPGVLGNVVAGRIANRLDLGGTNCVTDAACASTFSALSMAVNELYLGQSDMVITGGVDTMNDIFMYMCFSKTPALSASGDCRPFSDKADGTMLGEGLGMVALKRLEDAERDGDRVYAVIRGVGSSSDGRSKSVYAPVSEGQAKSLRRAYEAAGFGPETVELVEAHGTGTKAGDAAEFEGLRMVFDETGRGDRQWCNLGSVKSQIGHTKAAAGAAGLFKIVMALHHKVLPPTIKVDRPNPKLNIEASPFGLNTRARPWIRGTAHPRRASVSAFGFGGSNFHLALEEYAGPATRPARLRSRRPELVVLSAGSSAELLQQLRAHAASAELGHLAWLAHSSQRTFDAKAGYRLSLVCKDEDELGAKLSEAARLIETKPEVGFSSPKGLHYGVGAAEGKLAFVFPGQGSQSLDMGAELAMNFDAARAVWDGAANLEAFAEVGLHEVVFPASVFDDEARAAQAGRLTQTEWAQPAIGAVSASMLALFRQMGIQADCVGGHSFGEVTALFAAGVIDEADLLRVARRRGELMAEASALPGSMTAVSADIEAVKKVLDETGSSVVVANHNGPKQVVLSGATDAIEAVEKQLSQRGLRFTRLQVGTAFHSPIVSQASVPFASFLADVAFAPASMPVYSNAAAAPYPEAAEAQRTRLAEQIKSPVRFVEQIEAMYAAGVRTFVEVGPGSTLSSLIGAILKGRAHHSVDLDRRGRDGVESLFEALARLSAAGRAVDFSALWSELDAPENPATRVKPKLAIPLNGANYGKPYPPREGARGLPAPNPERVEPEPRVVEKIVEKVVEKIVHVPVAASPGVAAAPAAQVGLPAADNQAWLQTFQAAQQQTAEAHAAYQRAMADAHSSFLKSAETGFMGLSTMMASPGFSVAAPPMPVAPQVSLPAPAVMQPAIAPAPVVAPVAVSAAAPVVAAVAAPVAPVAAPVAVVAASVAVAPALDLEALLMEVVADKTGYPSEMLAASMDLEGDLGVDSIKRVEILSAMRERAPGLPEVDAGAMASLRTLGEIIEHMGAQLPAAPVASAPAAAQVAAPVAAAPGLDLEALLMEVVADKTGYPSEMLSAGMDLEGDLGVDSIKRVEILSAMRERAPGLPEVDAGAMASLRTLGEIIEHMGGALGAAAPAAPAAVAPLPEPASGANLGRFVLDVVPTPASGLVQGGLRAASRVLITHDGAGVAEALAAALAHSGVKAEVVCEVPADAEAVLFLGGLRTVETSEAAVAVNHEAFAVAQRVAAHMTTRGGTFVVVQSTGGDFGLSGTSEVQAHLGGLAGLAKTAAQEWPKAHVRAIDLDRGERTAAELAQALLEELLHGGSEVEVGLLRDGTRVTLRSLEANAEAGAPNLDSNSVVLVSGGARGVTAATVIRLAEVTRSRFVLLGRSRLEDEPASCRDVQGDAGLKRALLAEAQATGQKVTPAQLGQAAARILAGREVRSTVARIEAAGGQARYEAVDICDAEGVARVAAEARSSWGPISAIIHGAGVVHDKLIADKSRDAFDRVFDTKVKGFDALLAATRQDELKAILLFSSVSGRCGNVGQSDYAMANEVLNKRAAVEQQQRGEACRVRSLGWGPWAGGMVTPELEAMFEARGVPLIPLATGAQMLVDELGCASAGHVEVVLGGEPKSEALLSSGPPKDHHFDVMVARRKQPYLDGHAIDGVPVVPVVLALEWFARAATTHRPDLALASLRDLKVLSGIRLVDFEAGAQLQVVSRQISNGDGCQLSLELTGAEGRRHYCATAKMVQRRDAVPTLVPELALDDWGQRVVYGGVLFHGPAFQVIQSVHGMSDLGISARLTGVNAANWSAEKWHTDPAAFDGGLQLALLWSQHVLGGASLPTEIAEVHTYFDRPADGPVHCVLHKQETHAQYAVSNISFVDEAGQVLAQLVGVKTHLRPASPA